MRVTATTLISAAMATFAMTAITVAAIDIAYGAPMGAMHKTSAISSCTAEATAYAEVADIAHAYDDSEDLFAGALYELREQLLDCLAATGEDEGQGLFMPSLDGGESAVRTI